MGWGHIYRVGCPCWLPCMAHSLMLEHQAPEQDGSSHSLDTEMDRVLAISPISKPQHSLPQPLTGHLVLPTT